MPVCDVLPRGVQELRSSWLCKGYRRRKRHPASFAWNNKGAHRLRIDIARGDRAVEASRPWLPRLRQRAEGVSPRLERAKGARRRERLWAGMCRPCGGCMPLATRLHDLLLGEFPH
eukprot:3888667-Pleurochrysis_carterae.AAC.1